MSDLFQNPLPGRDAPTQPPAATAPAGAPEASLQEQLRSLQRLLVATLAVLLLLSGALNLFFLRQLMPARKDLTALRPHVQQAMANYQQKQAPVYQAFVNQLQAFAAQNPDFAQRLTKYNLGPTPATASPQPAR
jgi:hypothetical protein